MTLDDISDLDFEKCTLSALSASVSQIAVEKRPKSSVQKRDPIPLHGQTPAGIFTFSKFNYLPPEIRIQIYRHAIGERMIHIYERHVKQRSASPGFNYEEFSGSGTPSPVWRLSHQVCQSSMSESDICGAYAQPVVFANRIDRHMRPREEPEGLCKAHRTCYQKWRENQDPLNLGLLATSREAYFEATRLMYATNTWPFTNAPTFKRWFSTVPKRMLPCIRHLRFVIHIAAHYPHAVKIAGRRTWDEIIAQDIPSKFPGLRSLHVAIKLGGYVTCFRKSQARYALAMTGMLRPFRQIFDITEMFRPLRQLRELSVFTVRFDDEVWDCGQKWHDVETHELARKETFYQRREVSREWAEEIRELVLTDRK